jgi:plastocyanin
MEAGHSTHTVPHVNDRQLGGQILRRSTMTAAGSPQIRGRVEGPSRPVADPPPPSVPGPPRAFRPRRFLALLFTVGLLGLVAVGCGSAAGQPAADAPAAGANPTVAIANLAFSPEELTVPAGTTVTWVWDDGAIAHNVVGEGWGSEVMTSGTFAHRFDEPGSYPYVCTLHPNMTGRIVVTS